MRAKIFARIGLTFGILIAEFVIIEVLVELGFAPDDTVNASLSMLLCCVTYYVIAGFLILFRKLRQAFWVAICAFLFLCAFVCYSKSLIDFLTFLVSIGLILNSMVLLKNRMAEAGVLRTEDKNSNK